MDATSEAAFLPLGCLASVVLGPAVLLLVPGLKPGLAVPPVRSPGPGPAAHGGTSGAGHLAMYCKVRGCRSAWYRPGMSRITQLADKTYPTGGRGILTGRGDRILVDRPAVSLFSTDEATSHRSLKPQLPGKRHAYPRPGADRSCWWSSVSFRPPSG